MRPRWGRPRAGTCFCPSLLLPGWGAGPLLGVLRPAAPTTCTHLHVCTAQPHTHACTCTQAHTYMPAHRHAHTLICTRWLTAGPDHMPSRCRSAGRPWKLASREWQFALPASGETSASKTSPHLPRAPTPPSPARACASEARRRHGSGLKSPRPELQPCLPCTHPTQGLWFLA